MKTLQISVYPRENNPELCSTLSSGFGIVDDRIIIYDYILNMQDDSLIVEKCVYI